MLTAGWLGFVLCAALSAEIQAPGTPAPAAAPAPGSSEGRELVVLVHGMGRTHFSMRPVQAALEAAGYEVVNYGYPSRRRTVPESGQELAAQVALLESRGDLSHIHLVGHSLGNIVIRWVAANRSLVKPGRIVMLAPPNQGARLADRFAPWLCWLSEPLSDLTTNAKSAARTIPTPAGAEIGIIAGSRDHTVRVPETILAGQKDHIVVSSGHTFIMRKPIVHQLIIRFLRQGSFLDTPDMAAPSAEAPLREGQVLPKSPGMLNRDMRR